MHAINRLIQTSAHVENWVLLYTDSVGQSPSREADVLSGSQIRLVLWNWKVHFRVHIGPLLHPIRLIPVHTHILSLGLVLIFSSTRRYFFQVVSEFFLSRQCHISNSSIPPRSYHCSNVGRRV